VQVAVKRRQRWQAERVGGELMAGRWQAGARSVAAAINASQHKMIPPFQPRVWLVWKVKESRGSCRVAL